MIDSSLYRAYNMKMQIDCKRGNPMRQRTYSTTSRKKILQYLEEQKDKTVSVNDILQYLIIEGCDTNITTIYRYLDKLVIEGIVLKYVAQKGEKATYQFVNGSPECHAHLHMKCRICGRVIHLNCKFMDELSEHMLQNHGFFLECKDSILSGVCEECRKC